MSDLKKLTLDLDYLARTYGIDTLVAAHLELKEEGGTALILEGTRDD